MTPIFGFKGNLPLVDGLRWCNIYKKGFPSFFILLNMVRKAVPRHSNIEELRNNGFSIFSIFEDFPGIPDEDVLKITNKHNALLLTGDKDFGELVFRKEKDVKGVILIRLIGMPQEEKAQIVLKVFKVHAVDFDRSFTVIGKNKIRIKKTA